MQEAIRIVEEEIARRKENQPNIHCAHDRLNTLRDSIVRRIKEECKEN